MQFREMRRHKQQLSKENCEAILEKNTHGVLAVLGDGGYPYTVPVSYYYEAGVIYIHCAKRGHKLDAITNYDKVSFCVVDQDFVVPEEYTSYFRSVVVFGKAEIMDSKEEILTAINKLAKKYAPNDSDENRNMAIQREISAMAMIKINIAHMSGKEAIELVKKSGR